MNLNPTELIQLVHVAQAGDLGARHLLAEKSLEILRPAGERILPSGRGERWLRGAGGIDDMISDVVIEAVYGPASKSFNSDRQRWEGFIFKRLKWALWDGFERENWWNEPRRLRGARLKRQLRPKEEGGEVGDEPEEYSERGSSNPLELLVAQEERRLLRRAIRRIRNPLYRRTLILHGLFLMPFGAISKRLGVPKGTARSAFHRALRQLRKSLEGVS